MEYRNSSCSPAEPEWEFQHPITKKSERYVLGDRFHSAINPHKSPPFVNITMLIYVSKPIAY
jgi:hypothetical protein